MQSYDIDFYMDVILKFFKEITEYLKIPFPNIKKVVSNLINDIYSDEFYNIFLKDKSLQDILTKDNFYNLISFLESKGLEETEIKSIILNSPIILLFSSNLEDIYLIFKRNVCQGFLLLSQNTYRSYKVLSNDYENAYGSINSYMLNYDYVVSEMFQALRREDIAKSLNIDAGDSLKSKCDKLVKTQSLKNYFFKK